MKQRVIEILDMGGAPIVCYQIETIDSLAALYSGRLFNITSRGLREYGKPTHQDEHIYEKFRFVLSADEREKSVLSNVEPIRCYLRNQDMSAKVMQLNPYQSVGYLRQTIESERKTKVKLVVNEKYLTQDQQCLVKYIYEGAIIHVIEPQQYDDGILTLYAKEPGVDSKQFKIAGLRASSQVSQLISEIAKVTHIPEEYLCITYGGKILTKGKPLSQYFIQNNSCVYAVDSRKYMKRVPVNEYQKRITELKKVKQCNREIVQKAAEKNKDGQDGHRMRNNQENKGKKGRYTYERSGTIMEDLGDDNQYFEQEVMNLESEEFQEFERRGNKLEQSIRMQSSIKKTASEMENGRMVTNQHQTYEDEEGLKHERTKQRSVFRNGYQIVDVDITEDEQGNIIKVEQDTLKIKKDSMTGHTVKEQTDLVEDADNVRIVTRKQQERDQQGNIVRYQTSRRTQHAIPINVNEGTIIVYDKQPQTAQEKVVEIGKDGHIYTHQTKMVEKQGKTMLINKYVHEDPEESVVSVKRDVVEIEGDSQGNIHKHKSEMIEAQGRVTLIQTDQLIDSQGAIVKKEKDTINIIQLQDGSVTKQEITVIEEEDKTKIIRKGVVEDGDKNLIKSQTKVIQIENSEYGVVIHEQSQIQQGGDGQGDSHVDTVEKEISILHDQSGNTVTQSRQFHSEGRGEPTLISTVRVQNPSGEVIEQKTEKIRISESNQQEEVYRHITKYTEVDNKVTICEGVSQQNLDGSVIRSEKQTFTIQQNEDGTVEKSKTSVTQEDGLKTIHVKRQLQDEQGRLISKSSNVYQLENSYSQGDLNEVTRSGEAPQIMSVEKRKINRTYHTDEEGNLLVVEQEIVVEDGIQKVTSRSTTYDESGKFIRKSTEIRQDCQQGDGTTRYVVADIQEEPKITTVVETKILVDQTGQKIRTEQGTLQIEKLAEGLTRKEKQVIIEENGVLTKVHKQAYLDEQGNILVQEATSTEVPETGQVVSQNYTRKIEEAQEDESGNLYLHQREVEQPGNGIKIVAESEVIRGSQNELLKATTDVSSTKQRQDGTVVEHEINIVEKPGKVTVSESDSVLNLESEKLKSEQSETIYTQGQNHEIIKKQTNIYMDQIQKKIIEETIVEDEEGNITHAEGKSKQFLIDESGRLQQTESKSYQVDAVLASERSHPRQSYSQTKREVTQDEEGKIRTVQEKVVQDELLGTKFVRSDILTNQNGEVVDRSTRVVQIQNVEHGSIVSQQSEHRSSENFVRASTEVISDLDGNILCQRENKIEITENEGLKRATKTETTRREGETTVEITEKLEDQNGTLIDQSSNLLKIRDSEQALAEQARKVALAQTNGEIKSIVRECADDEQGNTLVTQKEVIVVDNSTLEVKTETLRSPEGEVIKSKTEITEQKQEDGEVKKSKAQIIEEGGLTQVVEFSEGKGSHHFGSPNQLSSAKQYNIDDLLGSSGKYSGTLEGIQVKLTNSIYNSAEIVNLTNQQQKGEDIESSGQVGEEKEENKAFQYDQMLPEQFYIVAIDKSRNEIKLRTRYDETIDEVSRKLGQIIGRSGANIHFFKDGGQLCETDKVADVDIMPGDQIYFTEEELI